MQPCNRIYYSKIYWRLNMFRAAYRSSSGAPNCICILWFIYPCGDRPLSRLDNGRLPHVYINQRLQNTVWSSWWWVVFRSKHVGPSVNFGIINSITRLHLVGYFYWFNNKYFAWTPMYIYVNILLISSENEKCFRQKLQRKLKHAFYVQ